ncbi:prepilin-type N-terminal cleavage/methylation domain-containing protein [Patescibacteria group bacterium]|nr:prepilin-type N-terminal cleavage/methylation domain-containing protein [Patescibacteria group bacterium]MBU1727759.1 prepilin-type N-terminal cleavage/methylation domain-containing protein [Patescibacteria group bacterium]
MIKFLRQKNKGFTLVETLVAVSIFSISILSIMVVLGQGVSDANYAKRKMIASYLAQEGIEYMRNMRDTFALSPLTTSSEAWGEFKNKLILASCDNGSGCYFDSQGLAGSSITEIALNACQEAKCDRLKYDPIAGYNYISGGDSGFSRKIQAEAVLGSDNEIKILSTVYWNQGSGDYSITLSENLYNWIE